MEYMYMSQKKIHWYDTFVYLWVVYIRTPSIQPVVVMASLRLMRLGLILVLHKLMPYDRPCRFENNLTNQQESSTKKINFPSMVGSVCLEGKREKSNVSFSWWRPKKAKDDHRCWILANNQIDILTSVVPLVIHIMVYIMVMLIQDDFHLVK